MLAANPKVLGSVAAAVAIALLSGPTLAAEPRLREVAQARGIEVEALDYAPVVAESPVAGSPAQRRGIALYGLPVRGAFETSWRGSVVVSRYPDRAPQLRPEQARVTREVARARLVDQLPAAVVRQLGGDLEALGGSLVYWMILGRPVLAWELEAPLTPGTVDDPRPTRLRAWVSAATGRVLAVEDRVFAANEADVYAINPQHTPVPTRVTLANLDPDPEHWIEGESFDASYLNGTRVRVFNCVDAEDGPFAPWHNEGECFPTQQVQADAEGDFIVPLPDVNLIDQNRDPTDPYAELAMYFHAEVFFAFMADVLGVEGFPCELSNMVANFHWLEPAPNYPELEFGPYNNAYYSGQCDVTKGPTMLFGQGSDVDFAFDGDVVYHELGHGIVQHLTPEGLRSYTLRDEGVLRDARALNESIADYHTMMITERPELADYVGFYWPDLDKAWIRNADNEQVCPRDMAGQEHNDSEPFTAALWSARRRIGGEKLDPVVIGALPMLGPDATLEEASAALMAIAAVEVDAGAWTAGDLEQLERALQGRGVDDCPRVVDTAVLVDEDPRFLYLRSNSDAVSPWWPGPVQYRHVVPPGSDNVLVSYELRGRGNSAGQPVSTDLDSRLLIKRSSKSEDAPITFTYELTQQGHADTENQDIDEVTLVTGDWDEEYLPTELTPERRQVLIRGLQPGEVVHIAFANPEREVAVVRELLFASVPSDELDEGSPSAGEDDEVFIPDDGCACTSAPAGGKGGYLALGLLVLAGLGRSVRRRSAHG